MFVRRFTPKTIFWLMGSELLLLGSVMVLAECGLIPMHYHLEDLIGLTFAALARGLAFKLFLDIADEYYNVRLSRLAWQALAIHVVIIFIRAVASSALMDVFVKDYYSTPLRGLLNHGLGLLSSVFLLLGLLGMLCAYRRAGLHPRLELRDYSLVVSALALFGWVVLSHARLEEGRSPWLLNRILQPFDLSLIGAACVLSIVLHRYALSFNGGKLAEALRWLVIYGLLPGLLVLVVQLVVPSLQRLFPFHADPVIRLWNLVPWALTVAAVVRAQMTAEAVAQVAKLQRADSAKGCKEFVAAAE